MGKVVYVGNFAPQSVGEPEIAQSLEDEGYDVLRLSESATSLSEIEKECQDAEFLLFAKFRVGTALDREEMMKRLPCPSVTWVFDLYGGLNWDEPL